MVIKSSPFSALFQDHSLWDVFRNSFSLAENKFDVIIKIIVALILGTIPFALYFAKTDLFPQANVALKDWANIGLTYTVGILGFLIAGFTIFFTITRIEVFVGLSKLCHKTKKMSQLQFVVYSFLRVFIFHLSLLLVSIAILMSKGFLQIIASNFLNLESVLQAKKMFVALLLPCVGLLIVVSVLQLKTFVWNLYQSILISLASADVIRSSNDGNQA